MFMCDDEQADLKVSLGLRLLRSGWWGWVLRRWQCAKLAPILIGESYTLTVKVDNLRPIPLEDVKLRVSLCISQLDRIGTKNTGHSEVIPVGYPPGHLARRDTQRGESTHSYLMGVIGPNEMKIEEACAGNEQLTMSYQDQADTTFTSIYNVESWNILWLRLSAIILGIPSLGTFLRLLVDWYRGRI
jgi:hypothetical protein